MTLLEYAVRVHKDDALRQLIVGDARYGAIVSQPVSDQRAFIWNVCLDADRRHSYGALVEAYDNEAKNTPTYKVINPNDAPQETGRHKYVTEEEIKRIALEALEPHFYIETEVVGKHPSGANVRIDAVIKPKNTKDWRKKDIAMGIEFKGAGNLITSADLAAVIAQSADYTASTFEGYGRLNMVFICPALDYLNTVNYQLACRYDEHKRYAGFLSEQLQAFVERMMIQFRLGTLAHSYTMGWHLRYCDANVLWSEMQGVGLLGKKGKLQDKIGHRN